MKNSVEIKNDIYWVGALDYDIKVFDVIMETQYGTSYNSYLVKGSNKVALIEASKDKFFDEYVQRIKTVIDPSKIDYLIVNHTEPDHTGSIEYFLNLNPNIEIIGTNLAIRFLSEILNRDFKSRVVKQGDKIDLGGKTLEFMTVPFLHWPDTMYTYCAEDKILFTCDSFGCHYADDKIFNDKIQVGEDFEKAYKYYFDCIMGPFKDYVLKALDVLEKVDFDIICPGHGPVLRENLAYYIDLYRKWSLIDKKDKIVVTYVSAYGYTQSLAQAIVKGIKKAGKDFSLYDLAESDINAVIDDIYTSKGLLVGSPTIAADALEPVWQLLIRLNPFINKGLTAGVFASYGWSGEGVKNAQDRLKQLKFNLPFEPYQIKFKPSQDELEKAEEYGENFAQSIK